MAEGLREIGKGAVLILALDRPARRNSMDFGVTRALADSLARASADNDVKAVVLQGHSHGFCAGSDLKALAGHNTAKMISDEREMAALARSFNRHSKPIVAAVDGFAIGGGAVFAASCDVVFTAADAKWALPEVPIGWNAAYGIAAMQARLGPIVARRVLWGAEGFDGTTAFRMGLADFTCEESAGEAALEYARKLAALPAHAVSAAKRLSAGTIDRDSVELDERAMVEFAACLATDRAQATLREFGADRSAG